MHTKGLISISLFYKRLSLRQPVLEKDTKVKLKKKKVYMTDRINQVSTQS